MTRCINCHCEVQIEEGLMTEECCSANLEDWEEVEEEV